MLFPPWTKETLIKEAIESPSTLWLEPVTSFDCDNTRDSQFDMPITRKAFVFHCFDSTTEVPSPHPQVDHELFILAQVRSASVSDLECTEDYYCQGTKAIACREIYQHIFQDNMRS